MPLNVHAQKKSVERSHGKEIRSTSQWQYVVAYIYMQKVKEGLKTLLEWLIRCMNMSMEILWKRRRKVLF